MLKKTLKELCSVTGVSGSEGAVTLKIEKEAAGLCDSMYRDAMGNLICKKNGKLAERKKIMFSAHTDEVGFMVNYIDDRGFIRFSVIGGAILKSALWSCVQFENGVRGVLVPENAEGEPKADGCYVDIGAANRREAERRVAVGDTFALYSPVFAMTGNVMCGRPLDNRAGCAVLLEAMKEVNEPLHDIYYVFSVQEEVGCRGAKTAAFGIMPDIGISLDVTATGDYPSASCCAVKMGQGVAVKIKDKSLICDTALVRVMNRLAKENGIKVQPEILTDGGTDAAAIQRTGTGVAAGGISIPSRNMHTGAEAVDIRDMKSAVSLVSVLASSDLTLMTEKENEENDN